MAIVSMANAVPGTPASSAEYNKVVSNIVDLDARLGAVTSGSNANSRLTALESTTSNVTSGNSALNTRVGSLESLTTNTATNGGHGNVRLSDRLGTVVGTGADVNTGSASAQLHNLRLRSTALEGTVNAGVSGNAALSNRVAVLETMVYVTRNANLTLGSTVYAAIPWTSAPKNLNAMWVAGNPTRLVVPAGAGGLYEISGTAVFSANGNGSRIIHIQKNGATLKYRAGSAPGIATAHTEMSISFPIELVAGDYVEIMAWQNSGGNLDLLGTVTGTESNQPAMTMRRVCP